MVRRGVVGMFRTRSRFTQLHSVRWLVFAALVAALLGCSAKISDKTSFMDTQGVPMSSRELRVRNYALADFFAARVEEGADDILDLAVDPTVRQNAILWKMHAIPAMQAASFFGDPLGATASQTVFCIQMRQYFESGDGRDAFRKFQPLALATAREVEENAFSLVARVVPTRSIDSLRARMETYAARNPIRSPRFTRGNDDPVMGAVFEGENVVGGLRAASAMNEQMRDLADRMALLSDYGPRQARWQVQYLREQVPGMASVVRDTALAAVAPVLDEFMEFLDTQRELTSDLAVSERQAVLASLSSERMAAAEFVSAEREAVFEALALERAAIMADLASMLQSSMAQAFTESEVATARVLDHALRRFALMMAVPFLALIALGFATLFVLDRSARRGRL